jgi:hypothetical protein
MGTGLPGSGLHVILTIYTVKIITKCGLETVFELQRQLKRIGEFRIATCNVHTLYRVGTMHELDQELDKCKTDICVLQEKVSRE